MTEKLFIYIEFELKLNYGIVSILFFISLLL